MPTKPKPISITITVSEPWDVGEAVNWQPIRGRLLQVNTDDHGGNVLVEFEPPICYRNSIYRYAVASPRLAGHQMTEVTNGGMVCSTFTGISDEQAKSDNPFDISKWRGGLAIIGDLESSSDGKK